MNGDQRLVAWMVVALIGLVAWTTYRPWLKAILFTSPSQNVGGGGGGAGVPWNPWLGPIGSGLWGQSWLSAHENAATGTASAGTPLMSVPGASSIPGQMTA